MKRICVAENENWDIIFDTIGMDIESSYLDKEIRDELSRAYQDILEADIIDDLSKVIKKYINEERDDLEENYEDEEDYPKNHLYFSLERLEHFVKVVKGDK